MIQKNTKGLSLLESILAIVILSLTAFSIQYLYVGLLKGTSQSEERRAALAVAETTFRVWRARATEPWLLDDDDSSTEAYEVTDNINEYIYRVNVGGRLENPTYDPTDPKSSKYLGVRRLTLEIAYQEKGQSKMVRLEGSVAK